MGAVICVRTHDVSVLNVRSCVCCVLSEICVCCALRQIGHPKFRYLPIGPGGLDLDPKMATTWELLTFLNIQRPQTCFWEIGSEWPFMLYPILLF